MMRLRRLALYGCMAAALMLPSCQSTEKAAELEIPMADGGFENIAGSRGLSESDWSKWLGEEEERQEQQRMEEAAAEAEAARTERMGSVNTDEPWLSGSDSFSETGNEDGASSLQDMPDGSIAILPDLQDPEPRRGEVRDEGDPTELSGENQPLVIDLGEPDGYLAGDGDISDSGEYGNAAFDTGEGEARIVPDTEPPADDPEWVDPDSILEYGAEIEAERAAEKPDRLGTFLRSYGPYIAAGALVILAAITALGAARTASSGLIGESGVALGSSGKAPKPMLRHRKKKAAGPSGKAYQIDESAVPPMTGGYFPVTQTLGEGDDESYIEDTEEGSAEAMDDDDFSWSASVFSDDDDDDDGTGMNSLPAFDIENSARK